VLGLSRPNLWANDTEFMALGESDSWEEKTGVIGLLGWWQ
jgi:hypothetical protein